jgi:hypothetical protein
MAASETTICNQALGKLGARRVIDLDEESNEARACRLHYAETRDEVLRHHRWNFAIHRETLSQLATPPVFGWAFQYQLPEDCLRLFELNGWDVARRPGFWEIEGRVLLTNEGEAQVRYISRVTDCNKFDALFIEALALKLASKIARPINGSAEMSGEFLTEYEKVTGGRARRTDAFEGRPLRAPAWMQSDLVFSRFSNGIVS